MKEEDKKYKLYEPVTNTLISTVSIYEINDLWRIELNYGYPTKELKKFLGMGFILTRWDYEKTFLVVNDIEPFKTYKKEVLAYPVLKCCEIQNLKFMESLSHNRKFLDSDHTL